MAKKCVVSVVIWPLRGYPGFFSDFDGRKASSSMGQDKHPRGSLGYARDRLFDSAPPSAVSRDKPVRRFAQDDDLVGVTKKNPNKLAPMGLSPQFQGGWRMPLKAPIELSNIHVP